MRLNVLLFLALASCSKQIGVDEMKALNVTSQAFANNDMIPARYTCDGVNVNPPLRIDGIPKEAQSLVLIVDDPDAPMGTWDHWIVFDILPKASIDENSIPGTEGLNSLKNNSYQGPCPPSGTHRYFFKVFALDQRIGLGKSATKRDVESAIQGHVVAKGQLVGKYRRA